MTEQELLDEIKYEIGTMGFTNAYLITQASILKDENEHAIGLDSLDIMALCMELEKKTGIEAINDDIQEFRTVGDLMKYFKK